MKLFIFLQVLPFGLNEKSVLLLFFFLNGLFFTVMLTRHGIRHEIASDIWLAVFIFISGLYIAPFMLGYAGWYSLDSYREWLFHVPLQHLYLLGPVFFFYVRRLTGHTCTTKQVLLHCVPGIGYLLFSLFIYVLARAGWFDYYENGRDPDLDFWYQFSGFLHMSIYFIITLRLYLNYRHVSVQTVSYADSILYRWLMKFLFLLLAIMILRLAFFVFNPEWGEFGTKFWYYASFSVLVYYISFSGYTHTLRNEYLHLPEFRDDLRDMNDEQDLAFDQEIDQDLLGKINDLLEESHMYSHPDLTLQQLADQLSVTPRQLSFTINKGFSMNFNDLINQYRTLAVQQKIRNGEHEKKSLLGLALECGFNSKSTFNRAFKKHAGQTPKEYIQNQ